MSKLTIKEKLEKLDKLNKSNLLRYMINASKSKTKLCHLFGPWSGSLAKDVSSYEILFRSFYSFDSIFLDIVWIDKLHNCFEGIWFNI